MTSPPIKQAIHALPGVYRLFLVYLCFRMRIIRTIPIAEIKPAAITGISGNSSSVLGMLCVSVVCADVGSGTGAGATVGVVEGAEVGAAAGVVVGVGVGVGVAVAVGVGVAVGVAMGVAVGDAVGVGATVAVGVGVGVGMASNRA